MKDLFVLVADADMQAVFRAILDRPDALGIREISSFVDRHPNRDNGVFNGGPEFVWRANLKDDYQKFIVAFDHHGSGCHDNPEDCGLKVQTRLDSRSFKGRSHVSVIVPELEEWLWHDPSAIADDLSAGTSPDAKERLKEVHLHCFKRQPRVGDFARIAAKADLNAWDSSASFRLSKQTLQNWFL